MLRRTVTVATLAALVGGLGCVVPVAPVQARSSPLKRVRYLGLTVAVPAGWPVFDLARSPRTCVRFDRHAVYLGRPGAERCPAAAIGRTEALLLQPATRRSPAQPGATLRRGRVLVTVTWRRNPAALRTALGLRQLPAPTARTAATLAPAASHLARAAAITTGRGFDACATPSESTMHAWLASPYRTAGIYLGGQNMACAQPNLSSTWVSDETAAGWHFIPTYVGLQAPHTTCGCSTINPASAASQGSAAAADAVTHAQSVGIGRGNPIYFDMEAYATGGSATTTALTFLTAWTAGLHAAGYLSGVYSSAASGISDLVGAFQHGGYTVPDAIWIADWNGRMSTTDAYVPSADWADHQRIHQYDGGANVTYGGRTLNIDGDYVDAATASAGSVIPDGTFVEVQGTLAVYRIAGGAPLPVTSWTPFGGPQPVMTITASVLGALNPVPLDGTFLSTPGGSAYRVAGGVLFPITNWQLFGGPQSSVLIDPADVTLGGVAGSHLNATPTAGTVVEGLPSDHYWRFGAAGARSATSAVAGAVGVDDTALRQFAVVPSIASPDCVVPKLHRLSLSHARSALRRAHCGIGIVHTPRSLAHGRPLRVHAQRPSPGSRRSNGHAVNLALL